LKDNIGVVFYDMTTIYFESSQPDELRMTGFSKEGKHQHPQILLGLLIGSNGYPIGYEIFEGNTFEGHTLIPVMERFSRRFDLGKPIVVADAGLLSNDNINALEESGYEYILGARIKNESKQIIDQIHKSEFTDGGIIVIKKQGQTKLFVSFSNKRAEKDHFNRERGLKRLEKSLSAGKLTKSNINNKGYNKYLKMEGNISIEIDYEKFEKDANWDGLKGYLTNTNLSGKQVIDEYNNLWMIEKAFRISKTDLKIRPIYHRLKDRIEAHICVSFMSYVLYKELERVLQSDQTKLSIEKAIDQIKKMYEVTFKDSYGKQYKIVLKSNRLQQRIIKLVNQNL